MHRLTPSISSSSSATRRRPDGFTLVEVVMALGIFAFAFIPVIGMMDVGLKVSKDSIDSSVVNQIFRLAEARAVTSGTLNFSSYGDEDTTPNHINTVYQAVLSVSGSVTTDAAQGLLARQDLQVIVVRSNGNGSILNKRVMQLSKDPADLSTYF